MYKLGSIVFGDVFILRHPESLVTKVEVLKGANQEQFSFWSLNKENSERHVLNKIT